MRDCRVAILGGSFDPVHLGHLFLLHCAATMTDYKSFLVIPAKLSNFKQNSLPKASDYDRVQMLKLALLDYYDIYGERLNAEVSTLEIERGGISYTSDTVKVLRSKGFSDVGLIMGDDHIRGLANWHEFEYLAENVEFIICPRSQDESCWEYLPAGIRFRRLEPSERYPQSSTAIRANVGENLDFLSRRVCEYVKAKHLYE